MPLLYSCPGRMRRDNRQLHLVNTSMLTCVSEPWVSYCQHQVVRSRTLIADESRSVTDKIPASLNRIKACPHRKYARYFDVGKPRKAPDLIA